MKKLFLVTAVLFLGGCTFIPTVSRKELDAAYVKKTIAEQQLQALEVKHTKDLQENLTKLSNTKDDVIDGQDAQLQSAADSLYSIHQAILYVLMNTPTNSGAIQYTKDRSLEGMAVLGKSPTIKEILEGGERLKKYIYTYQQGVTADIIKLQEEHEALVKENGILVATTEAAKKEVEKVRKESVAIEAKYIAETTIAHKDLDAANNSVIQKEKERADAEQKRADSAAARERLKKQLMLWCGVVALAATAGAIWSPLFKKQLIILAATAGGAAAAIPYIEPWMVFTAFGVIVAAAAVSILRHSAVADTANTNFVNAMEDSKKQPNATVDDVLKNLKQWNTVYVKDKFGNVTTEKDTAVKAYIESKLISAGRLEPDIKTTTPPSGSVS